MARKTRKRWQDFSKGQQALMLVLASVQLSLAATAWVDLARRPAKDVKGSKGVWAAVIALDFVGPILYFLRGRRHN